MVCVCVVGLICSFASSIPFLIRHHCFAFHAKENYSLQGFLLLKIQVTLCNIINTCFNSRHEERLTPLRSKHFRSHIVTSSYLFDFTE
uniref:Putative secreted peptide n=1 Tax=Anopheles braziliensis TaxID=58242 RepID=A0A2M3ZU22_9DIPT